MWYLLPTDYFPLRVICWVLQWQPDATVGCHLLTACSSCQRMLHDDCWVWSFFCNLMLHAIFHPVHLALLAVTWSFLLLIPEIWCPRCKVQIPDGKQYYLMLRYLLLSVDYFWHTNACLGLLSSAYSYSSLCHIIFAVYYGHLLTNADTMMHAYSCLLPSTCC